MQGGDGNCTEHFVQQCLAADCLQPHQHWTKAGKLSSIRTPPQHKQKTPGYCWSFYIHATRLLLLRWIREIFGPSTTAYARHYFRHLGDDQQYPPV
jgi:hypothetical protein